MYVVQNYIVLVIHCYEDKKIKDIFFFSDFDKKDKNYICSLPYSTGPCKASIPSYSYNKNTKECNQFIYGGCGGNMNRFRLKEHCENYCREEFISTPTSFKINEMATTKIEERLTSPPSFVGSESPKTEILKNIVSSTPSVVKFGSHKTETLTNKETSTTSVVEKESTTAERVKHRLLSTPSAVDFESHKTETLTNRETNTPSVVETQRPKTVTASTMNRILNLPDGRYNIRSVCYC